MHFSSHWSSWVGFSADRHGHINSVQGVLLLPRQNYLILAVVLVLHLSWGRCLMEPGQGWARSCGWWQDKHSSVLTIWWYSSTACSTECREGSWFQQGSSNSGLIVRHILLLSTYTELELNNLSLESKQHTKKQIPFGPLPARIWRGLTTHLQGLWLPVIKVCLSVI